MFVVSQKNIKPINCPENLNSASIDEFLLIFCWLRANGISTLKIYLNLTKKKPRLIWGSKILNLMGIKNIVTNSSIKIFGNPHLKIDKKITIKNFLKDHRVFMTSVVAALTFGGTWNISDKDLSTPLFRLSLVK